MATYIYPTIVSLPIGYGVKIPLDEGQFVQRLATGDADIRARFVVYRAGQKASSEERILSFRKKKLVAGALQPFAWTDPDPAEDQPFGEMHFEAADDRPIFCLNVPFSTYAVYSAPGKKSFFSDASYKYGSPPIINQMAMVGRFVETFTVVHLDRARDLGETLSFINPYMRAINVQVLGHDGRAMPRTQIAPLSCRHVSIEPLLGADDSWLGQIHLTATNRLVVYHIKHSLRNPRLISDHEHLDPFRAEDTHWPLTRLLRTVPARWFRSVRK